MLALAYLNQYYGIKFDGLNIKNMMTFKPDFYGKNVNVLDRLISFASMVIILKVINHMMHLTEPLQVLLAKLTYMNS